MKSIYIKMIALVVAGASFQVTQAQTEPAKPAEKTKEIAIAAPVIAEAAPEEVAAPVKVKTVREVSNAPIPEGIAPAAAAEAKKEKAKQKEKVPAVPPGG